MVYVPYYDPSMVYGPWPWSDYPPFYLLPPPGVVVLGGLAIGFGFGFPILGPFWGWHHWDWRRHRLDLDGGRVPVRAGYWEHDASHRRGVPYRNASVAARYRGESAAAPRDVRGCPGAAGAATGGAASERGAGITPRETPTRVPPANLHTAPSAFESFAEGARVRDQAARGAASRGAAAARTIVSAGPRGYDVKAYRKIVRHYAELGGIVCVRGYAHDQRTKALLDARHCGRSAGCRQSRQQQVAVVGDLRRAGRQTDSLRRSGRGSARPSAFRCSLR